MATYYDPFLQGLVDKAAVAKGTSPLLTTTGQKFIAPATQANPPASMNDKLSGMTAAQVAQIVAGVRQAEAKGGSKPPIQRPVLPGGSGSVTPPVTPPTTPPVTPKTLDKKKETEKSPLPNTPSRSSLVEFADALNQATALARQTSRANELGILGEYGFEPGKVRAATMGQMLGLLEKGFTDRVTPLQTAAQDAFKMKEEEKKSIQQLALDAMTKYGLDSTQVQSILAHGSLNEALVAIAPFIKEGGGFADIREVKDGNTSKLIGIREDGTVEDIWTGTGGSSTEYKTYTENGRVYQYAVDPTTGQAIGGITQVGGGSGPTDGPATYEEGIAVASAWTGTANELRLSLNADKVAGLNDYTDGQIEDLVKLAEDKGTGETILKEAPFDIMLFNYSPSAWRDRDSEVTTAIKESINDILTDNLDEDDFFGGKELTQQQKDALVTSLKGAKVEEIGGDRVSITIGGVTRIYKEINNKLVPQ